MARREHFPKKFFETEVETVGKIERKGKRAERGGGRRGVKKEESSPEELRGTREKIGKEMEEFFKGSLKESAGERHEFYEEKMEEREIKKELKQKKEEKKWKEPKKEGKRRGHKRGYKPGKPRVEKAA